MARVAGHRRRPTGAGPSSSDVPTAPPPASAPDGGAVDVQPGDVQPGDVQPLAVPPGPDLLVVGRIGKPQGIRGEVTVEVRTDDPDARFADGAVLLTDPPERGPVTVASSRSQNGRLMVAFAGVEDRNDAELLRGTLLQVDATTLPAPEDEDEFHDHVLRGMSALLPDGQRLGAVVDVLHLPHGDVLVVARDDNGSEVLVPFVKAMVPEVDVAARSLVLDPPEGLLELTDGAPDEPAEPPEPSEI